MVSSGHTYGEHFNTSIDSLEGLLRDLDELELIALYGHRQTQRVDWAL